MDWGTISPKMTVWVASVVSLDCYEWWLSWLQVWEGGELTDQDSGAEYGGPTSTKRTIENDGKGFICDDIAEKQRDENPVLALL